MNGQFAGKSVLITGAGGGIGRAAAIRFAQEGALVSIADLDGVKARSVAAEIGGDAIAITGDISRQADNEAMVDEVVQRFGGLDVAYLNAGYLGPACGFEETNEALFDRLIGINLKGTFWGLKAVQKVIRSGGAAVVTASTAGVVGFTESPGYAAAKHGVVGLVKSSVAAFAAKGARVNAICPGAVDTAMIGGRNDHAIVPAAQLKRVPLRATGSPQHVAELALWLASPAAGFITGQAHVIDGGLLSSFVPAPVGP